MNAKGYEDYTLFDIYEESLDLLGTRSTYDQREFFYQDIVDHYRGRPYHNIDHIRTVVDRGLFIHGAYGSLSEKSLAQFLLAAIYHDIIYVPGFEWNEQLSADYAVLHLELLDLSPEQYNAISNAILATRTHHPTASPISNLLIDCDLYELGTDAYWDNSILIRKEFGNPLEADWVRGRSKFLHSFLLRDKIYTNEHDPSLEASARNNMKTELKGLL